MDTDFFSNNYSTGKPPWKLHFSGLQGRRSHPYHCLQLHSYLHSRPITLRYHPYHRILLYGINHHHLYRYQCHLLRHYYHRNHYKQLAIMLTIIIFYKIIITTFTTYHYFHDHYRLVNTVSISLIDYAKITSNSPKKVMLYCLMLSYLKFKLSFCNVMQLFQQKA